MPLEEPVEEGLGLEAEIEGLLGSDPADTFTEEQAARFGVAGAARLRGLDTLTNEVSDFTIAVGETLRFERLIVSLEACRFPAESPEADAYAFLRIRDERDDTDRFTGWMLASSPALSALDHPRYDVWVLSCTTD
ncbi:DUF2155 domain-containing protein [Halovulum dunhuangense]|uniref:DUF2155 domain-containing protein n=2 Tax=Halovulum dunhuangense TaxID=1505036 RepID=A0A849L394_9RHOB|nr:DUF2155 domain-containing protein [Halovulum dunhuangense]